ncbi:hypothetical protein PHSY_005811 [Pseudozyma hubeiensis SY62]|uniref:Uncharacterized protein n=1 Tax=Pseudozyma hubeiensis (strain SY62) TaxID=1305764 RepID=R9PAD7_PSEHS|nr:hypothetical protein PHSY_005811 [Pseudozyma hubeiensis SY62]GAC98222.1 hypothetical protein PHSY_005811 [Pseudozyma hubeiensis SY62]
MLTKSPVEPRQRRRHLPLSPTCRCAGQRDCRCSTPAKPKVCGGELHNSTTLPRTGNLSLPQLNLRREEIGQDRFSIGWGRGKDRSWDGEKEAVVRNSLRVAVCSGLCLHKIVGNSQLHCVGMQHPLQEEDVVCIYDCDNATNGENLDEA